MPFFPISLLTLPFYSRFLSKDIIHFPDGCVILPVIRKFGDKMTIPEEDTKQSCFPCPSRIDDSDKKREMYMIEKGDNAIVKKEANDIVKKQVNDTAFLSNLIIHTAILSQVSFKGNNQFP